MSKTAYSTESHDIRLTLLSDGDRCDGFKVELRSGTKWETMSVTSPLSHLIYQDKAGNRQQVDLSATQVQNSGEGLSLSGEFVDVDEVKWSLTVTFTPDNGQIIADYHLAVDSPRSYFYWKGPALYAGHDSFGGKKDEALFPGLEYLLGDEPSSSTRFAAPKFANRRTPDPYRITIPLMAVSHQQRGIGLLWDANQEWGSAWRHPGALFASPNEGNLDHAMALFCPSVNPRWFNEGDLEAHKPVGVNPANPLRLTARIAVNNGQGAMGIVREWVKAYGLPVMPPIDHDYTANVELCVTSYVNVAWDEQAEGWHHTLADPWGPRFEPNLCNQLWRYSRWTKGDPTLQAHARDQVRRALPRAAEKLPAPWNVPQIELALVYGAVVRSLEASAQAAREAMAEQQADGSWGWTPAAVADIADFKTEDRLSVMGAEKDSATGFTSSKVIPVWKYALYTGDPAAVESLRRAADWCNAQPRPEGAQTWELHLHVPDVLAAPYLMNLNVAAYQLTGEGRYLQAANRWAWSGLPFIFLWNGYYRPIMRYGTVPVFGVTFHDVQSWFGVIVQWNGLVYADALFRLAKFSRTDGPADWHYLAEAITRHGMQEQATEGPWKGMYPDAFSTVKGDEDYIWWLNPQLIGLNSFPLAGLNVNTETTVLRTAAGQRVHITSGGMVHGASERDGSIRAFIQDEPGMMTYSLVACGQKPSAVKIEGTIVAEVGDVDSADHGWRWIENVGVALVKWTPHTQVTELEVMTAN